MCFHPLFLSCLLLSDCPSCAFTYVFVLSQPIQHVHILVYFRIIYLRYCMFVTLSHFYEFAFHNFVRSVLFSCFLYASPQFFCVASISESSASDEKKTSLRIAIVFRHYIDMPTSARPSSIRFQQLLKTYRYVAGCLDHDGVRRDLADTGGHSEPPASMESRQISTSSVRNRK